MSDFAGGNLAEVTGFGLHIYDGSTSGLTNLELDTGFANIEFTGAPGYLPVFFVPANPIAPCGNTPSITLTGTVGAVVGYLPAYLASNTVVTVTINGNTQSTVIDDATGDFSINLNFTNMLARPYPITYTCASDNVSFVAGTNDTTGLVVGECPPIPPWLPFGLQGMNLVVPVPTMAGHTYYLLQTTNLSPPVVWTTNTSFAGTGGMVTNLVPITLAKELYLKFQVN